MTGSARQPEMTADDVCDFLARMDADGIRIWLDGGWGVDACLGSQTRRHSDLDIVIEERDVQRVITALQRLGYGPVPRGDTRPWNFVLGDDAGRQIDFHVIVLDEGGRGIYGPRENQDYYPAEALAGKGTVKERAVAMRLTRRIGRTCPRCASASASQSPASTLDSMTKDRFLTYCSIGHVADVRLRRY